ncbi:glycoside hydrolase family 172 protein [Candidatus Hydrogenedentota bacterium]
MTISNNMLKNMMVLNDNSTKRISSWDRTGGNKDCLTLEPGETVSLAEIDGPGIINHFYVTMMSQDLFYYRRVIVRMYWDGEETPSVEVPIGDFFGVPFSKPVFFQSLGISVNPGNNRLSTDGLNIYFPMPFAKHARIELFNDSEVRLQNFWYHINYEETDALEPDLGYFHASWNRENTCEKVEPEDLEEGLFYLGQGINLTGDDNYVILDAEGRGNYAGCILQVDNITGGWYGEGDDMIFIDGEEWPPSLHGTGTEEIFGGGACPNEAFFTPYCGFHQVENPNFDDRNAMYKFFVNDPVRFKKSIRVTLEHGHANNLGNDYASTAYWYQAEPHRALPKLPDAQARIPRVSEGCLKAAEISNRASVLQHRLVDQGAMSMVERKKIRAFFTDCKKAVYDRNCEDAMDAATKYIEYVESFEKGG